MSGKIVYETTFAERYPTGRKHCRNCGRWRPVSDFEVYQWLDRWREIPLWLEINCYFCNHPQEPKVDDVIVVEPESDPRNVDLDERIIWYDAHKFYEYLEVAQFAKNAPLFINDRRLTRSETRALSRWRQPNAKYVRIDTVEVWCEKFNLRLWEINEKAGKMTP